jgi:deazaflavin-dependent oxidoreductase (nitroreductase family)
VYFHGGVYVIGDAFQAAGLAAQIGRRTRARVISVDYRLAPEHPYPAAVDDALAAYQALLEGGTAPSDIVLAGESAGGGLGRRHPGQRPRSRAAPARRGLRHVPVCRPHPGRDDHGNQARGRPAVHPEAFPPGSPTTRRDTTRPGLISPIFADLSGLPPLIIQAGTHEVLLDDAIRLARQAATADVEVTLDITPGVPHVFQAYYPILDEAAAALDRAGQLLSRISPAQNASPPSERQNAITRSQRLPRDRERQEFDMSEPLDWNAKTIAEFRANEGRVGGNFEGAPMVLVHHRGRTSGREYVTPTMYLPHDTEPDIIYVFAPRAGAPTNPDWYHNLTAAGDGSVERGTETYKVTVRELTGAERDRIYAEQARRYPGFAEYARQTAGVRTIPVLELRRA